MQISFINIIKKNNTKTLATVPPPSIEELAGLSAHVYGATNNLPQDWGMACESVANTSNYRGCIYYKSFGTALNLVYANRGTVFSSLPNLYGDIQIALNMVPIQLEDAQNFLDSSGSVLQSMFPQYVLNNSTVTLTGHSMGAIISDLLYTFNKGYEDDSLRSITFENPGSLQIISNALIQYKFVNNDAELIEALNFLSSVFDVYLADVNVVNTCNQQLGSTYRLLGMEYDYTPPSYRPLFPVSDAVYMNPYYLLAYSFGEHGIDRIHKHLFTGGNVIQDANPAGIQQGYIEWLDFDKRNRYWLGFRDVCWDIYSEFREQYENDKSKFDEVFEKTVRIAQADAKGKLSMFAMTSDPVIDIVLKRDETALKIPSSVSTLFRRSSIPIKTDDDMHELELAKPELTINYS